MCNYKPAILVVDDEFELLDLLRGILQKEGYRVDTAADGLKALEVFNCRRHDIAIVDIKIPGMDGVKLSQRIKEINPKTEIILMTGYSTMESTIEVLKAGTFDYFLKPIKMEEIIHSIERALEKQRLVQKRTTLSSASGRIPKER